MLCCQQSLVFVLLSSRALQWDLQCHPTFSSQHIDVHLSTTLGLWLPLGVLALEHAGHNVAFTAAMVQGDLQVLLDMQQLKPAVRH